jgi:sulfopyruvate decarboxylase alpha subunit
MRRSSPGKRAIDVLNNWRRERLICEDAMVAVSAGEDVVSLRDWPLDIYKALKTFGVSQVCYVPDAGHSRLITLSHEDSSIETTVLTTEEEGVALCAGAWLGGSRAVLLMQSSGVGNCVNMLSLMSSCRLPLLTIVTMRGEWAEFNPWQIPMGSATPGAFALMGVTVLRIDHPDEAAEVISAAANLAFDGDQQVAVLISQRMLGRKKWVEAK